jgi:hypothetical protein
MISPISASSICFKAEQVGERQQQSTATPSSGASANNYRFGIR